MTRFQHVVPVQGEVFTSRGDPNDVRMGDVVVTEPRAYPDSHVVLLGCPQDEGVRRNRGRTGARLAPVEIRRALYRYPVTEAHATLYMMDVGDLKIAETLEETHEYLYETVLGFLRDGKKVIVLGGGNDISYPDCRALSAATDSPQVINIDRHLDVRIDERCSSGTPYRQLLEEGIIAPEDFHEVGINSFANSPKYLEYVESAGAHIHYLGDLRSVGVGSTLGPIVAESGADGLFFGFDLDVVRAVDAPGVSDPGPMGLTAREVCEIADVAAGDPRTRIIEITEVNPEYDRDGITCKLAANIIMRALAADQEACR